MSSAGKAASRYSSFESQSSTSSSSDLKSTSKPNYFRPPQNKNGTSIPEVSRTKPNHAITRGVNSQNHKIIGNERNFVGMVKQFMEKRSNSKANSSDRALPLIVPADFIAEDLKKKQKKKTAKKGSNLAAKLLLFGGSSSSEKKVKALTEVKTNTRTLAMVLRSERELLSLNQEQESQIAQLTSLLEQRTQEVEKLKNLCLKQREEIKALKSAILFPEEMNCQLEEILEKQGSELKQAKQVIPSLQRQISCLTGHLQTLSEDLAEVKAGKYTGRPSIDGHFSSPTPRTLFYNQEEAANSLDFNSDDSTMPGSPDDMLLKDVNPCLTPSYSKKEYKAMDYDYAVGEEAYEVNPGARKLSRSSDRFTILRPESSATRRAPAFCKSDESKCRYGKRMNHQLL